MLSIQFPAEHNYVTCSYNMTKVNFNTLGILVYLDSTLMQFIFSDKSSLHLKILKTLQ